MLKVDLVRLLKRYDLSFFGAAFAIFIVGILNLYSATYSDPGVAVYKYQMLKFLVAIVAGVLVSFIHPKTLYRYSYFIYGINVIFLVLVLVMGRHALGATRWLSLGPISFQPSEMMKLSVILVLARWFTRTSPEKEIGPRDLIVPAMLAFIPAIMIIIQPDLGTGMIILLIFSILIFYRRLKWKYIFILLAVGVVSGTFMYKYGLKEYQRNRIRTFIDPEVDAKGTGYNAIQSEIAIGSGQLFGKGFKKSSQASLNYLPENHTDFVFSVFNEEHGFFGSIVLISLYIILFFRFLWLASSVLKVFDAIVAIGLLSLFFLHTFINMAMVTGLLPIVGLPLPLMSYGGSSLVTFIVCCGMATSLSNSRNLF